MHNVLIVDDSDSDRRFVGTLLEHASSLNLAYATDGEDALAKISQSAPDVVVTDLVMPRLDGLELVEKIRDTYPSVPVILMTSKGNEEIAAQALQLGASSYVPKRTLSVDLMDTLSKVLRVTGKRRHTRRLMGCLEASASTFILDNDKEMIPPLVRYLQEGLEHIDLCGQAERTRIGIAVDEALVNALYHGNLDIGSELREMDYEAYYELVEQRLRTSPYCDRKLHVNVSMSADKAEFIIRDEGDGFDPSALPDPTDPRNLDKVAGRGVYLMQTFMDEVIFNEVGNEVTLIKRRNSKKEP